MNLTRCSVPSLLCALLLVSCGDKEAVAGTPSPAAQTPAAPTADVLTKLAAADEFDGKADKVVSKCPACKLGMDGHAENELAVGDYKLMFCNADQKKAWAVDPNKEILALEIPAKK